MQEDAAIQINTLRAMIASHPPAHVKVSGMVDLARLLIYVDLDEAEQLLQQVDSFIETNAIDNETLLKAKIVRCHIHLLHSENDELFQLTQQLLEQKPLPPQLQYDLLELQGYALADVGQYDKAFMLFQSLLQFARANQMPEVTPYLGFAQVSNGMKRHQEAINYADVAYEKVLATGDEALRGKILVRKASIQLRLNQLEAAIVNANEAATIFRQQNYNVLLLTALGNLGRTYLLRKQYKQAETVYTEAYLLAEANNRGKYVSLALQCLGEVSLRQKQFDASKAYLHQALDVATTRQASHELYISNALLSELHRDLEQYEQAYQHSRAADDHFRVHYREQMGKQIAFLEVQQRTREAQYKAELHQREVERLKKENEHAEMLAKLKDKLLNEASHDLKHPLTAIYLYLDLLEQRLDTDKQTRKTLGKLRTSANQMEMLITSMLDFAQLQSQTNLETESVDLIKLARKTLHAFQPLAQKRNVLIGLEVKGLTRLPVRVNSAQFQRVLTNIISNSLKYSSPNKRVMVKLARNEAWTTLTVADEGVGIDAEELPFIFDQFYRASSSVGVEGTGLGLAICKAIVERHNGRIEVQSVLHEGTEVAVLLPNE